MSKPVNPYVIGAFLTGSLLLAIAAVLIFGGGQLLKQKNEYVIFFDSALNGLKIGAPVTLEGVQIGMVSEIALEFDQNVSHIIKPVVIQIDQALMQNAIQQPLLETSSSHDSQQTMQLLIDAGLKAQLKTQSLLTGLLYVEFSFHRHDALKLSTFKYKNLVELPAVQTTEDKILNTAEELMTKFRQLPLEAIATDLSATLKAFREISTSEDVKQDRIALQKTLLETEKLVANLNLTVLDTRTLVRQFSRDTRPVLLSTEKTLDTANTLLIESNHSLNAFSALAAPEAPLWQSLVALRDAARSTKELSDYLQQHPDAIIFGKD
ncbi:MlaD family protein [Methylomonas sp. AM2-LC]|uniref:MlaD family protein n=1 Tax=Methylomonas sp. AM2-LC TaxID=3153301 RepID=UPI0032660B9F